MNAEPNTNSISIILDKLDHYSRIHDGKRCWDKTGIESFRQWLLRYLKRNPVARNEMINAPKSQNNLTHILDHFSKHFVMSVPFKII